MKKIVLLIMIALAGYVIAEDAINTSQTGLTYTLANTNAVRDVMKIDAVYCSLLAAGANTATLYHVTGTVTNEMIAFTNTGKTTFTWFPAPPLRLMPNDKFMLTCTYTNTKYIHVGRE